WRGACFAYAAIQIIISLPILLLALPRRQAPQAASAASAIPGKTHLTKLELPVFAVLAAVLTLGSVVLSIVGVHLLPLLQARGVELATAVLLGTFVGPSQVGARVIEMFAG